ncbi:hypothetical protein KAFR_0G02420 [Kazachstania africana CBS 2517]|uniref:WH1 domain-containing protein n=1 Tax=Kazachstania africana (strain ATCC 22294 / BCRC 22015 / CBS 2517 / CECT 1963 / NBRC 1671 / NRRL Y-8276) TaxID=1071382 RepID=H2AY26_KAZAF|nr:hypothetical protein KAFR_0G02420 [Kazachstania africana CBS 2517]CCF59276.1 hypothetical protein KAFR_0G02420 [Kazachstania africana CBS 2517]
MGLLNNQDKEKIKRVLPKNSNKIIDVAIARLYIAYPKESEWTYTGLSGAITLIDDLVGHTFFLKLVDIFSDNGIIWDQELYVNFQYYQDRTFFHSFEIEECYVGLLFVDTNEASHFLKRVQKREKYGSKKTLMNKNALQLSKKIRNEQKNVVTHGPRGETIISNQRQRYNYENVENLPSTKKKAPPPPPPVEEFQHDTSNTDYDTQDDENNDSLSVPSTTTPTIQEQEQEQEQEEKPAPVKHSVPPLPAQFQNNNNPFPIPESNNPFPFPQQQANMPFPIPQQQQANMPFPIPQQQQAMAPAFNRPLPTVPNGRPVPVPPRSNLGGAATAPPPPPARRGPAPPPPPHRGATTTNVNRSIPPPVPASRRGPVPPPPPRNVRNNQSMNLPSSNTPPITTFNTNVNATPYAQPLQTVPVAAPVAPPMPNQYEPPTFAAPQSQQQYNTPSSPVASPMPNQYNTSVPVAPPPPPMSTQPNTAAPPPPPPPIPSQFASSSSVVPPPPPPPSAMDGNSGFVESTGDTGRDALLASIRQSGGISALKKVDKSQLDKPSALLQEARGEQVATTSTPSGGNATDQASLADALAAALNQRKSKISGNDDHDNGDDW